MGSTGSDRSFLASGEAYDCFMGRYSHSLAEQFADEVGLVAGHSVLDVGCGPVALTGVLVDRLGSDSVSAFDPSAPFVAECSARYPGVDVRLGRAEAIPFADDEFDGALAQLVLHFLAEPEAAAAELRRVLRPGGLVAASVWDFAEGMQMLRLFWDAALSVDPGAPDEAQTMRFGREGEIAALLAVAGFAGIVERTLAVSSMYAGFDELWAGFTAGVGPAGSYCAALPDDDREKVRRALFDGLGSPAGSFSLEATARVAHARVPG